MLTVNIKTKNAKGYTVAEETRQALSVRLVTTGWRDGDGNPPEHPGITLQIDPENAAHYGPVDDQVFDFFVMNEEGQTVARYVL